MIALDSSALMEILLDGAEAATCSRLLESQEDIRISAGTLAETMIVAAIRGRREDLALLLEILGVEVEPVGPDDARAVAQAYSRWGKGVHPAKLNFGDCFAYALAVKLGCPLLFVGDDFSRTDVRLPEG